MRAVVILLFFTCIQLNALAQEQEALRFAEDTFDFGSIRQDEAPFIHDFTFVNNTSDTIQIADVQTSCGCTTPFWTATPVAPGDSGRVQAKYSADRMGTFHKTLSVSFTGVPSITLAIQGKVLPGYQSPVEELPTAIGHLHMKYRSVNVGKVKMIDSATTRSFDLYNSWDQPLRVDSIRAPQHVQASVVPAEIAPDTKAQLIIAYDAKLAGDLGFHSENITLYTSDSLDAVKSMNLYATVAEYFPPMSEEELKKAPKLTLQKRMKDLDKIRTDSSYTAVFTLTNTGRSPLEIRKVAGNCGCISAEISRSTVKPGKTAEVTVVFDTANRKGNQQKTVTIYSNDPMSPEQRLTVKGYISVK